MSQSISEASKRVQWVLLRSQGRRKPWATGLGTHVLQGQLIELPAIPYSLRIRKPEAESSAAPGPGALTGLGSISLEPVAEELLLHWKPGQMTLEPGEAVCVPPKKPTWKHNRNCLKRRPG